MKNKYEVIIGNVGTMPYTSKKLAKACFDTYVTLSKTGQTRAAHEDVTLLKNGEVIEEYHCNKILAMFELNKIRELLNNCPSDEVVILCPNWPINKPAYDDGEAEQFDIDELEQILNCPISVSQYNDLIADVHGISND